MAHFALEFEWNLLKAQANFAKHGVSFEQVAEVFRDSLALTVPDDEHSLRESRWITLGKSAHSQYMLVIHTYDQLDVATAKIRIISARRPSRAEISEYEEQR
jgi:uncharacterized DUF497 family protein